MAFLQKKNNAKSTVADDPLLAGATVVNLPFGEGALFPSAGDFLLTLWDISNHPDPGDDPKMEIVRATARVDDAITITRAQEGTADVEHTKNTAVQMLITAGTFDEHLDQNLKTTDSPHFSYDTEIGESSDDRMLFSSYDFGGGDGIYPMIRFNSVGQPIAANLGLVGDFLAIVDADNNGNSYLAWTNSDFSKYCVATYDGSNLSFQPNVFGGYIFYMMPIYSMGDESYGVYNRMIGGGLGGTTVKALQLDYKWLGDGSDGDGIQLCFAHRNDTGILGNIYDANYITSIQNDNHAGVEDTTIKIGGYAFGSSYDWLTLTGFLANFQSLNILSSGIITVGEICQTRSGTITRDGNGYILTVARTSGKTYTITRDGNNLISSFTDGTLTWTLTRNASNQITSWAVT